MEVASRPLRPPVEHREAVIDRVTRLDQARRRRDRPEAGREQQLATWYAQLFPRGRRGGERPERERNRRHHHQRRDQQPNDMDRGDAIDHEPGAKVRGHEGDRAPQPHGAIGAPAQPEPLERIGIGKRQGRRRGDRRQRDREQDRDEAGNLAQKRICQHRSDRSRDQRRPERAPAVGKAREEWNRDEPHEHRSGEHDAGGAGIEPLRLQPDREERHDDSGKDEHRRIECCEPRGKAVRCVTVLGTRRHERGLSFPGMPNGLPMCHARAFTDTSPALTWRDKLGRRG